MSASTAPARPNKRPSSGGEPRRPIHRLGGILAVVAVVFVLAWLAWNLWLVAFFATP